MPAEVEVAAGGAHATLVLRGERERPATLADGRAALQRSGVVAGLDEAALARLVATAAQKGEARGVVARALPAADGVDGRVEVLVHDTRTPVGTRRADGRVDFRDHGAFATVEAGQVLARLHPAQPGKDGRDVTGKRIAARPGKPARLPSGEGTRVAASGAELRAARAGVLRFEPGRLSVDELLRVSGDLGHRVGSVTCRGSVLVSGDVLPGFRVQAQGDVRVDGSVEAAQVKAGGGVAVGHGIVRGSRVEAGGEVRAGHVAESRVIAGGDVRVARELVQATVDAQGSVLVEGGRVVGGVVRARRDVEVAIAGRKGGVRTELAAGVDPETDVQRARLRADLARLQGDLARCARLREQTRPDRLARLEELVGRTEADVRRVEAALAKLDDGAAVAGCRARIGRELHEDVRLRVGPGELVIAASRRGGQFRWDSTVGKLVEAVP